MFAGICDETEAKVLENEQERGVRAESGRKGRRGYTNGRAIVEAIQLAIKRLLALLGAFFQERGSSINRDRFSGRQKQGRGKRKKKNE